MKKILQLIIVLILAAVAVKVFLPDSDILPDSVDKALDGAGKIVDKVPGIDLSEEEVVDEQGYLTEVPRKYQLGNQLTAVSKLLLAGAGHFSGDQKPQIESLKKQFFGFKDGSDLEKAYGLAGLQATTPLLALNKERIIIEQSYKSTQKAKYKGMEGSKLTAKNKKEFNMKEQARLWNEMVAKHRGAVNRNMSKLMAAQSKLVAEERK